MKASETITVIRLLFLSFRLIFATAQPSTQESVMTMNDMTSISHSEPITTAPFSGAVTQ